MCHQRSRSNQYNSRVISSTEDSKYARACKRHDMPACRGNVWSFHGCALALAMVRHFEEAYDSIASSGQAPEDAIFFMEVHVSYFALKGGEA